RQVLGVESLGEPIVDRLQQTERFLAPALALPQPGETGRGAQLPRLRALLARVVERNEVEFLRTFGVAFLQEHPAFQAQDLGVVAPLFPAWAFHLGDNLVDELQRAVYIAEQRCAFREDRFAVGAPNLATDGFPH